MLDEIYVRIELADLERPRPRRPASRRALASRMMAVGAWLEKTGNSMAAELSPQE